jgi:predicted RecA/RadA family phage recombinase
MKSYRKEGMTQTFTAPAGGVTVDVPLLIGGAVVVPKTTAAAGVQFEGMLEGIFDLPKTAGVAWVEGVTLYFDSATASFATVQSATARRAGIAMAAALLADTVGRVKLMNVGAIVNVA